TPVTSLPRPLNREPRSYGCPPTGLIATRNNKEIRAMLNVTRRRFFSACGAGAAAAAIAPLVAQTARAAQGTPAFGRGFGALNPKVPLNADALPSDLRGVPLLALPEGFEYTALSITGQTMSDGNPVP